MQLYGEMSTVYYTIDDREPWLFMRLCMFIQNIRLPFGTYCIKYKVTHTSTNTRLASKHLEHIS